MVENGPKNRAKYWEKFAQGFYKNWSKIRENSSVKAGINFSIFQEIFLQIFDKLLPTSNNFFNF
mgnify:CR=1 FL=1